MKIKHYVIPVICIAVWSIVAVFFIFEYRFSFNYETYNNEQYNLVFIIPYFLILLLTLFFKKKKVYTPLQIIGFVLLGISLVLVSFSRYYSFGNEYFFVIVAIGLTSSGLLVFSKTLFIEGIIYFILLLFFYEIYVGYQQSLEYSFANNGLYLTGTLQNSGIYGCYLIIQLPFLYWLFFGQNFSIFHQSFKSKKEGYLRTFRLLRVIFFTLILILTCFLVFKTQSRTAYISFFVTTLVFLIFQFGGSLSRFLATQSKALLLFCSTIMLGVIGLGGYYLFNLKKMSAFGRLMKLDITWQHIVDNFWFGTGLGRFTWYYPRWQAQYFATHPYPPKSFIMSSGESFIIFNEFLQLFKEVGFVAFLFFVWLLIVFFRTKSKTNKHLLNAAKLTVIAILACGITSYPIHVNIFLLVLFFSIIIGIKLGESGSFLFKHYTFKPSIIIKSSIMIAIALTLFTGYQGYYQYTAAKRWDYARDNMSNEEMEREYNSLYPYLQNDGKFLTEYGMLLNDDSSQKASYVLENAKQFFISKATIEALANAYMQSRNYAKAIDNYQWLCHFLPNQFIPKHNLLQAYLGNKDSLNIIKAAKSILGTPIKIASPEVEQIRSEAQVMITEYK